MPAPSKLTPVQIEEGLKTLQGWELREGALSKLYKFKEFLEAIAFVNRVAQLAEAQDHHPDILIRYNKVTLTLVTHSAGGLTQKDFQLARAVESSETPREL